MRNKFLGFFIVLLMIYSCHDNDFTNETRQDITKFTSLVFKETSGNITGYVYDEQNKPVADALVQIYSSTTKTNKYGSFSFRNVKVDQNGTYLTVRKGGYFLGSDMLYPDKRRVYSYVKLMALNFNQSFEASKGGNIEINGGGSISFVPNSVRYEDGSGYNGLVKVASRLINPNDKSLADVMPGGLIADAGNGNTVVLGTLGMIAVELRSEKGEKLNLIKDKKATISIPVLTSNKPNTIPLWSFDESKGRWKEEGIATLKNDQYVGEVSHFSFWNCDYPFPLVHVCGKVLFSNGKPAKNVYVSVEVEGLYGGSGITDEEGVFCGKMPKDKKLKFKISNGYCSEFLFTADVDPITKENTVLDPFILPEINDGKIKFSGKVVCDNIPVKNITLILKINDFVRVFSDLENGFFSEDFSFLNCLQGNATEFEIMAFDEITGKASTPKKFPYGVHEDVVLDVCLAGCDFEASISADCDARLKVDITNGSGSYTYKWSNGATTQQIVADSVNNPQLGTYCVTVTEVSTSCTKIVCKTAKPKMQIFIEGGCEPNLSVFVYGGLPPYSYLWSNGKSTPGLENLQLGIYSVTVTDSNGCTAQAKKEITQILTVDQNPYFCNNNKYSLKPSIPIQGGFFASLTDTSKYMQITSLNNLDIFKTTFIFNLSVYTNGCEGRFEIKLPNLEFFDVVANNTTCGTCADGYLVYTQGGTCFNCQTGDVKIFNVNDLDTDLSDKNNMKKLDKGEYYAVVVDKNTGCYIAFQKVKIK